MITDENISKIRADQRFKNKEIYQGIFQQCKPREMARKPFRSGKPLHGKVQNIDYILDAVELKDGMTISFHHALRNGDYVMGLIIEHIARKGIKDLTLAVSSLSAVQDKLLPYLEEGVITAIDTSGCRGELGKYIQSGKMEKMAIFRTHGGRARAIESGELHIDVAFIAAPMCDIYGNINGVEGKSACGALGYAMPDAEFADHVVAITDTLVETPLTYVSIRQTQVDYIAVVDCIGDPAGITTGSIRISKKPAELVISNYAAQLIAQTPYFKDRMIFQFGSGGLAISTAGFLREKMVKEGITASAGVGGVSGFHVKMMEEGLIKTFYDPQDFDLSAIESLKNNSQHQEISVSAYANPWSASPYVNLLDVAVLSATEMDMNFNVNVLTDSYGRLLGAPGGHPDAAAGAKFTVITMPLLRGRLPMLLEKVTTVVTPGESVDALVTEYGIAINPRREDILPYFEKSKLPIMPIEALYDKAMKLAGNMSPLVLSDDICGLVEYRDGSVIDVIHNK